MTVYLDYHSTTPVDPRVADAMQPALHAEFGNPASRQHEFGLRAELAVETARAQVAALVGATPAEVIFTSGATEANNLAILGTAEWLAASASGAGRAHVITCVTEHPAVLDPVAHLEQHGWRVTRLPVACDGTLDPQAVADAITDDTALVTVMAANNEVGVLHDLATIGAICRERGVRLHSDAAQAVGRVPLDLGEMSVDLLSISAHKMYGPKGVGALIVRDGVPLAPILHGGGHERGLRSGTLNVPGIVGFGAAAAIAGAEMAADSARVAGLRSRLLAGIQSAHVEVHVNGPQPADFARRLPGNLNISVEFVDGEQFVTRVARVIAVSSGSACTSATAEASHVLEALQVPRDRIGSSIRLGLGRFTTDSDVDTAIETINRIISRLRAIHPMWEMYEEGLLDN